MKCITFLENVDNWTKNRYVHFADVTVLRVNHSVWQNRLLGLSD